MSFGVSLQRRQPRPGHGARSSHVAESPTERPFAKIILNATVGTHAAGALSPNAGAHLRQLRIPRGAGEPRRTTIVTSVTDQSNTTASAWPKGAPVVGQSASRSRLVHTEDIVRFTEISGDRNPLHYNEAAAKARRFGGTVVQGGVTSAILNAVVAEDLPGPGTVFLNVNWSFRAPVRPGDTITGEVTVTEVRQDKPITKLETRVVRQDGIVVPDGTAVCYTIALD